MKIKLYQIAHARAGDKGDISMISLITYDPQHYSLLHREVTPSRVNTHFANLAPSSVERFELPSLGVLNFVLKGVLGGGVTRSLMLDGHGKTLSSYLLDLEVDGNVSEIGAQGIIATARTQQEVLSNNSQVSSPKILVVLEDGNIHAPPYEETNR